MTQKAKQKLQAQPDEDFYLTCAATGEDLLSIEDGITRVHISHGQCASCGLHFSLEHLKTVNPPNDSWPVIYEGLHCKTCCARE